MYTFLLLGVGEREGRLNVVNNVEQVLLCHKGGMFWSLLESEG